MMNARFRKTDGAGQVLSEHCREVAYLAGGALSSLGLEDTGRLVGLLHDMGKAPVAFQDYLEMSYTHPELRERGSVLHAPIGAIFAYERWFDGDPFAKLTAQVISMAVYGHHAGLPDCLNEKGESPYLRYFSSEEKEKLHYREAVGNYLREIAGADELDKLFARAKAEISALFARLESDAQAFQLGMIARMVLGALVDADRWDSACFEHGADPLAPGEPPPDWAELLARLEAHLSKFTDPSTLNDIRTRISRECLGCASLPPGIFTLTVPTGGGKTFSTLRYALAHADGAHMRRIFYVIPFNTILDQNAADIREALNNYEGILEHHSGVVRNNEDEEAAYRLLTERWDSPIVLTSMVQFLNTLYRKENSDARRMGALAHSVLIFDEVQALPKRCTHLFEQAIRFLVRFCGCTVVLCTATQPRLDLPAQPMIGEVSKLFEDMQRVRYVDQSRIIR
ncbi:CRISPR-associated endonuclease Cas3'' [Bacillota bacterium Meth-B3]